MGGKELGGLAGPDAVHGEVAGEGVAESVEGETRDAVG